MLILITIINTIIFNIAIIFYFQRCAQDIIPNNICFPRFAFNMKIRTLKTKYVIFSTIILSNTLWPLYNGYVLNHPTILTSSLILCVLYFNNFRFYSRGLGGKKIFSWEFIERIKKIFDDFWQINFCMIAKVFCFRIYYKIAM